MIDVIPTIVCFLMLPSAAPAAAPQPEIVRVGIYQNAPKLWLDAEGQPRGFHVDILEAIAAREGWKLVYVPGSWAECKARLENATIDLMPDVAYSLDRAQRFDFNREVVLYNWARLYTRAGLGVNDIFDLEGRTVAVVEGDISYDELRDTVGRFGVKCSFIEVGSFREVFEHMDAAKAEAGLISRLFGLRNEHRYDVSRTFLVLRPARLHFAAPEGKNARLLAAIDRHLADFKEDRSSVYYRALSTWIKSAERGGFPAWLGYAAAAVLVTILLLGAFSLLLRRQVRARTSELARANRELEEHRDHLESLVAERTAELSAANRELDEFAHSVSHDLRAPLRAVKGFNDILIEDHAGQLGEAGRDHLHRVRRAVGTMSSMIEDILALSRTTRGTIERRPVDLSALAGQIEEELRAAHPGNGVQLDVQPGLTAQADPRFARTLLANLLGNAWKFTAGEPAPRVVLGSEQRDGQTVYFVRDNGAGFDPEQAGDLFAPFLRLHHEAFEGHGIGLATVQRIVRKHGGRVWAEGEPGRGATFYFTLAPGGDPERPAGG